MSSQAPARAATVDADELTVVSRRHIGRWLVAVIVVVIGVLLIRSVVTNPRFGWDQVNLYLRDVSIGQGLLVTCNLTVLCMIIGVALGVVLAVMRLSAHPMVRGASFAYVSFFRGTPGLVQLLFWYNIWRSIRASPSAFLGCRSTRTSW